MLPCIVEAPSCAKHTNGFNLGCNGTTTNGVTNGVSKHIASATAQAKSGSSSRSKRWASYLSSGFNNVSLLLKLGLSASNFKNIVWLLAYLSIALN